MTLLRMALYVSCMLCVLQTSMSEPSAAAAKSVLVFAAASTNAPLSKAVEIFEEQTGQKVVVSFAGSSALAQQISQGAPAQLYISANIRWMDYLENRQILEADSRASFLTNRLVLVQNRKRAEPHNEDIADLPALLAGERLAVGDPDHVPAGLYAREALTNIGIWRGVQKNLARQPSVTSAVAMVESNEAPYGIVYASDAYKNPKLQIVALFPDNTHSRISYQIALVKDHTTAQAKQFYEFLLSRKGQAIFEKYGFIPIEQ